ncbi:MAG: hypothetical protein P8X74_18470 [Reinekea sp.]
MLPKNWGEPMGAPAIFEKQIEQVEIKLLHPASTLESRIQVITLKGLINNTNDQSGSVDHNPSKNSR